MFYGLFLAGAGSGAVATALDPAWALPLNTLLLIVQLVIGGLLSRRIGAKVDDAHDAATHGAAASASSAEAAADAARIAKEIGSLIRTTDASTLPTGPTAPGEGR